MYPCLDQYIVGDLRMAIRNLRFVNVDDPTTTLVLALLQPVKRGYG
jgi:hypothetical protein